MALDQVVRGGPGDPEAQAFATALERPGETFVLVSSRADGVICASEWSADVVVTKLASYPYPQLLRMGFGVSERQAVRRMKHRRVHPLF